MCFWKIKTPVNPQLFVLLRIYRGLFLHFTNVLTELSQQERYFFSQCCCFFSLGHLVSCECHLDLVYKRVFACCFLQIAERFFLAPLELDRCVAGNRSRLICQRIGWDVRGLVVIVVTDSTIFENFDVGKRLVG